ncbi:hypothetical protein PSN45_001323 [Yamadazyma tenuis]|uniref:Uncharacterized protein n=1 Tax=Candida tenuis (strain ATCC 10573 / BCRC 21748 / CBS 615 / JCM 9827 / NBRC 10315 / NRRL Y-1498 / VKM Y-70) TaxID=590646 RepID=G3BD01_CANTC|nr:uncharacterized protein CANTEDRAFT_116938 [Yamadazyma tenuis ATCC 10573]XP_006690503.1 uncharacterized protein CANTEDRAFT_116938 [Yamadazyma tenuis ATCC 10573]EGV61288.1 hypothetical protein CANTEDRAFT_116938 [Yamadazyma tenuis ATCC 10573]EGV61289.1 hypothetical protein CANTEDRAFT_116938 [Yamadazyma tenuis ATCC 10573]WEJ93846.1 hypothetical protein PSN45_001323 [Yamadazyma tenuis]
MSIKLEKSSLDDERDVGVFEKPAIVSSKPHLTYLSVAFLLSVVVFIQSLFLFDDHHVSPQFTLRIKEDNSQAVEIMSSIRSSLKVVTFLAEDFSFSNYTGINDIDTFDEGNVFHFFYDGYKKDNNHTRPFVPFNGLDIMGCLVKDFGVELSLISKSQNPQKLIDSFSLTYSHTIMNLDEMYHEAKKTSKDGHMSDTKLKVAHDAYKFERFGKTMRKVPMASLMSSFVSCVSLLFVLHWACFRNVSARMVGVVMVLQVPSMVVQFGAWGAQLRFYYKVCKLLQKFTVADLRADSGYVGLVMSVIMVVMGQVVLAYILYKKRGEKH